MSTHRKEEDLQDHPPQECIGELQEIRHHHLLKELKNNFLSSPFLKDHSLFGDPLLHQDPQVDSHHDHPHAVVANPSNENEEENQMHSPTSRSIVSSDNNYTSTYNKTLTSIEITQKRSSSPWDSLPKDFQPNGLSCLSSCQ